MLDQRFYWGTTRKAIVAFGNMFNFITIDRKDASGNSELVILDVLNREVYTGSFSGKEVEIDLSNFVKGTYILQLKQNNKISRLFFMKQ